MSVFKSDDDEAYWFALSRWNLWHTEAPPSEAVLAHMVAVLRGTQPGGATDLEHRLQTGSDAIIGKPTKHP